VEYGLVLGSFQQVEQFSMSSIESGACCYASGLLSVIVCGYF
jgi:hypothetical protein